MTVGSQHGLSVDSSFFSASDGAVTLRMDNVVVNASDADDLTRHGRCWRQRRSTRRRRQVGCARRWQKEIEPAAAFGRQLAEQAVDASNQAASVMNSAKQTARGEVARRRKVEASVLAWQMEAELKGAALAVIKAANADSAAKAAQAAEDRERAAAEANGNAYTATCCASTLNRHRY